MADAPRPLGSQPLPPHPPVADPRLSAATDSGPKGDARSMRLAKLDAARVGRQTAGAARRAHPSRSARTVALMTSLLATGGVGAALAAADRGADEGMVAAAAPGRDASASPDAGTASPSSPSTSSASGSAASGAVAPTPSSSGSRDGTYTGEAEWTRWGDVQVKVTISNGALTDVAAVQIPSGGKSSRINAAAQPILEREAIAQQDADLDIVSGATYTSRTYAASLQAALDQAALTAATGTGQP